MNIKVQVESTPVKMDDHDKEGIPDLMIKFNRSAVQDLLKVGEYESIVITG